MEEQPASLSTLPKTIWSSRLKSITIQEVTMKRATACSSSSNSSKHLSRSISIIGRKLLIMTLEMKTVLQGLGISKAIKLRRRRQGLETTLEMKTSFVQ